MHTTQRTYTLDVNLQLMESVTATTHQDKGILTIDTTFLQGWLVVLRINVALAIFQPYRDFEAGDNQSLK